MLAMTNDRRFILPARAADGAWLFARQRDRPLLAITGDG
jgi:hypothetical protein